MGARKLRKRSKELCAALLLPAAGGATGGLSAIPETDKELTSSTPALAARQAFVLAPSLCSCNAG